MCVWEGVGEQVKSKQQDPPHLQVSHSQAGPGAAALHVPHMCAIPGNAQLSASGVLIGPLQVRVTWPTHP